MQTRALCALFVLALLVGCAGGVPFREFRSIDELIAGVDQPTRSLMLAAANGDLATAELALNQGAKINGRAQNGWTPLFFSLWYEHDNVSKMLIARGADVNAKENPRASLVSGPGYIPGPPRAILPEPGALGPTSYLQEGAPVVARVKGLGAGELVELMIAAGANVWATDADGHTVWAKTTDPRSIKALLKAGMNANDTGRATSPKDAISQAMVAQGQVRPIHRVAKVDENEGLRILLDAGADPNAIGFGGATALAIVAERGNLEGVKLLLERGANVNLKTSAVRPPLWEAAVNGHREIVALLLERGADLDFKAWTGKTLLESLDESKRPEQRDMAAFIRSRR